MFGPLKNVIQTVIIIDSTHYIINGPNSPVVAVNKFFKILTVLKKQFAKAAKGPWQYLQNFIYNLNSSKTLYSQVRLLNTKITNHKRLLQSKNTSKETIKRKSHPQTNSRKNKKSKENAGQVLE